MPIFYVEFLAKQSCKFLLDLYGLIIIFYKRRVFYYFLC